jgi:hypothetical protein
MSFMWKIIGFWRRELLKFVILLLSVSFQKLFKVFVTGCLCPSIYFCWYVIDWNVKIPSCSKRVFNRRETNYCGYTSSVSKSRVTLMANLEVFESELSLPLLN